VHRRTLTEDQRLGRQFFVVWSMRPWECVPPAFAAANGLPGSHGPSITR
jgi:hypothetical protein